MPSLIMTMELAMISNSKFTMMSKEIHITRMLNKIMDKSSNSNTIKAKTVSIISTKTIKAIRSSSSISENSLTKRLKKA